MLRPVVIYFGKWSCVGLFLVWIGSLFWHVAHVNSRFGLECAGGCIALTDRSGDASWKLTDIDGPIKNRFRAWYIKRITTGPIRGVIIPIWCLLTPVMVITMLLWKRHYRGLLVSRVGLFFLCACVLSFTTYEISRHCVARAGVVKIHHGRLEFLYWAIGEKRLDTYKFFDGWWTAPELHSNEIKRSMGRFPLLYIVIGCAFLSIVFYMWRAVHLWRNRLPPSACTRCRYDLTGNVSGVCPECGREILEPT